MALSYGSFPWLAVPLPLWLVSVLFSSAQHYWTSCELSQLWVRPLQCASYQAVYMVHEQYWKLIPVYIGIWIYIYTRVSINGPRQYMLDTVKPMFVHIDDVAMQVLYRYMLGVWQTMHVCTLQVAWLLHRQISLENRTNLDHFSRHDSHVFAH